MSGLTTIEQALRLVLERSASLSAEDTPLSSANGRVLATPAIALVDLPPFRSSAMDGFAVRSEDTPGELDVAARVAAGAPTARTLGRGEAIAISTGGEVPVGADAVVPIEHVEDRGETVVVRERVVRADNVRPQGGDVLGGTVVVPHGALLGSAQIGAIAATGIATVRCARRPRVSVVVTGPELREPGETLGPGQIYDANGALIAAQIRSAGAEVDSLLRVGDDEVVLRAALALALDADVVITTGGASVGEHDLVRRVAADLGVEEVFWGVAVRPGKPISFGTRGSTLSFGLPGNPVSALVGFELFVRPALLALQGAATPGPVFRPGRLTTSVRRDATRDGLVRARSAYEGDHVALEPVAGQESHMVVRAAAADALVLVPRGTGEIVAGAFARYITL